LFRVSSALLRTNGPISQAGQRGAKLLHGIGNNRKRRKGRFQNTLYPAQLFIDGDHARHVGSDGLRDRKGPTIVARVRNTETGRNPLLRCGQLVVGDVEGLKRD